MNPNNGEGGANTVLIVVLLLVVVGIAVWYFTKSNGEQAAPQDDSLNINLSLGEENGETLPQ